MDNSDYISPMLKLDVLRTAIENPENKRVVINGREDRGAGWGPQTEPSAGQKIAGVLLIVFFIAGLLSAIVFSQTEPLLCLASVGALFFVFGMFAVFQHGISLDSAPVLIVPFAGAAMVAVPCLMLYQKKHPGSTIITQNDVINLVLVSFFVLGIMLIVLPHVNHSHKMRRCSQVIFAKCIYLQTRTTSSKSSGDHVRHYKTYSPIWQYELADTIYVTSEDVYTNVDVPELDEMRNIRIDPNEPSYIYRPQSGSRIVTTIVGIIFAAISVGTLLFMMKK